MVFLRPIRMQTICGYLNSARLHDFTWFITCDSVWPTLVDISIYWILCGQNMFNTPFHQMSPVCMSQCHIHSFFSFSLSQISSNIFIESYKMHPIGTPDTFWCCYIVPFNILYLYLISFHLDITQNCSIVVAWYIHPIPCPDSLSISFPCTLCYRQMLWLAISLPPFDFCHTFVAYIYCIETPLQILPLGRFSQFLGMVSLSLANSFWSPIIFLMLGSLWFWPASDFFLCN